MSLSNSSEAQSTAREHRAAGAVKEYAAIATGAGIASLGDRLVVRVSGDDRIPFMHGMCSNDIKGLATGSVSPALILTEHAHIIADFFVYAADDTLLLEIDRSLWAKTREHLEKFLVADDVEFEELDDLEVIDVEGPLAARVVATVAGDAALSLKPWHYTAAADSHVANLPRHGAAAFTLIVERARVASLIET